MMEEFGATSNRRNFYAATLQGLNDAGIPWLFWEVYNPGNYDGGDYEVWTDDPAWNGAIVPQGRAAANLPGSFSWPTINNGGIGPTAFPSVPASLKGDWDFCVENGQCANSCCSRVYSNDNRFKCTPGAPSDKCTGDVTIPNPCGPGKCLSQWGYCGSGVEYCGGSASSSPSPSPIASTSASPSTKAPSRPSPNPSVPTFGTNKGNWEFCGSNTECANSCCANVYSGDGRYKCTPGASADKCTGDVTSPNACPPGMCLSQYGWCGTGSAYCGGSGSVPSTTPGPSASASTTPSPSASASTKPPSRPSANPSIPVIGTNKGDWDFCGSNGECANSCCSNIYSNDGRYKCTPGAPADKCTGDVTSPNACPSGMCLSQYGYCGTGPEYCSGNPVPPTPLPSTPSGGGALVSEALFNAAMSALRVSPPAGSYRLFLDSFALSKISNLVEAAMYFANLAHESGGFRLVNFF
jgi:hypothetical protein